MSSFYVYHIFFFMFKTIPWFEIFIIVRRFCFTVLSSAKLRIFVNSSLRITKIILVNFYTLNFLYYTLHIYLLIFYVYINFKNFVLLENFEILGKLYYRIFGKLYYRILEIFSNFYKKVLIIKF